MHHACIQFLRDFFSKQFLTNFKKKMKIFQQIVFNYISKIIYNYNLLALCQYHVLLLFNCVIYLKIRLYITNKNSFYKGFRIITPILS